jgi:hypothetical protein
VRERMTAEMVWWVWVGRERVSVELEGRIFSELKRVRVVGAVEDEDQAMLKGWDVQRPMEGIVRYMA